MTAPSRPQVLVVGIGNPDRGDDSFAAAVLKRLRVRVPPRVRLLEQSGDILALIDAWNGFEAVILVDAAAPIAQPGQVHHLDLASGQLPIAWSPPSTHAFGLGETVELARSLGRLPHRLILYHVEGENFDIGAPLSSSVADAIDAVAERILTELSTFLPTDQLWCAAADA